ncbi:GNAT family N-acetyltransferase [Reinekea blandensis]|uniref:Histone acetyltransferase HPA2 n=1 Tax=Reinekea blandensis MED297 TaxID=314283 RepID=A4B9Y5_9GAMM|nr:GNAT family N-acetyltransferase [Reinekea blandensis]EAR11436.1 histone acetyltransferase HPA2 [Reinekea sp. MED297] [Reinekea blandensis MED297]
MTDQRRFQQTMSMNSDPSPSDVGELYDGLDAYNMAHLPGFTRQRRLWTVRNDQDELIAGLYGQAHMSSFHVDYLWIDESARGHGLGSMLIQQVETEARALGIYRVYLDTYTFQAPGFYAKLGFVETGRFQDFPTEGVDKIFLVKDLSTPESEEG